jgi:hypothetical protein
MKQLRKTDHTASEPGRDRQQKPLTPGNGQRFTTPQIAHRYQVTDRTIQSWRDEGKIPFIKINSRCIRYDPDAVEKALSK